MSSGAVEKLKEQTGLAKKPMTFHQLLENMKPQIQMALPRHLNAERMIRIALTNYRMNQKLAECVPESIIASIMVASQLGLEPGVLGQCYLVPYKDRRSQKTFCQLIPGWMGVLDLVNRTGKASAWTGAVYKGDEFDWQLGDKPYIVHRPCGNDDPKELTHVYAVARTKSSEWPTIEVWPIERIWKHRNKINKVGESHYSYQWQEMYARKVPLLQVLKYVPRSIELATALSLEEQAEMGGQQIGIKDVPSIIEGTLAPPQIGAGPGGEENPFNEEDSKPEPKQVKPLDEVCGNCGGKNGSHEPDCKHAKKAEKEHKPHQTPEWKKRNGMLWAKAGEAKISEDDIHIVAKEKYGVTSCSDLQYDELQGIIERIDYIQKQKARDAKERW